MNRVSIDRHKNSRQQSFSTECRETTGGGCACDAIVVRSLLSSPYTVHDDYERKRFSAVVALQFMSCNEMNDQLAVGTDVIKSNHTGLLYWRPHFNKHTRNRQRNTEVECRRILRLTTARCYTVITDRNLRQYSQLASVFKVVLLLGLLAGCRKR